MSSIIAILWGLGAMKKPKYSMGNRSMISHLKFVVLFRNKLYQTRTQTQLKIALANFIVLGNPTIDRQEEVCS